MLSMRYSRPLNSGTTKRVDVANPGQSNSG